VAIALKVAAGLHAAHEATNDEGEPLGVVHRDVSPQNIVVSYDGVIKLLDFGVAKASARLTTTRSGVVRGKFAYMSPEQCLGKAGVDHRSDIFSLGVVLYELLTGVSPFIRSTEVGTLRAVMEDPIGRPEHRNAAVDTELSDIVMRALERDAGARYGSARELQTALEAWSTRRGEPLSSTRIADHVREVWADDIQRGVQLSVDTDLLASLPRSRRHLTPTPVFGDPTRPVRIQRHEAPRPKRQNRRFAFGVSELVAAILLGSVITWLAWPEPPSAADKAIGKPEATVGRVTVESTPPGATVYENGHPIGVTPLALVTMSPGRHTIELRLEGHQPTVIDLDVGPEATVVQRQLVPEGGAE
jgi:serine/threonine-protein kinase